MNNKIKILLAPTLELAEHVLGSEYVFLTVEAEYGLHVAEGCLYTAAHHQAAGSPYAGRHVVAGGRPSPCNDGDIPHHGEGAILVSHVDLDTFGGCLRALPGFDGLFGPEGQGFWDLAETIDVRGAHKLPQSGAVAADVSMLRAFWAWSKGVPRFPRDSVTDVTETVIAAGGALLRILAGDAQLLAEGEAFGAAEAALNARTCAPIAGYRHVLRRSSDGPFCNHLYTTPGGEYFPAVVAHNVETGSVTVSLADPIPGVSCRDLVQALWGTEAGGHAGIAGSPRGRVMTASDFEAAAAALETAIADHV